jgi:hypothetical protein
VLVLDTFSGSPRCSRFDSLRTKQEYTLPEGYPEMLRRHAASLGISDQIDVWPGEFCQTFTSLERHPLQFSFAHIDANLYESTWHACNFVMPRMVSGSVVVFDDYHGPCDLGARLAIDRYLGNQQLKPIRLSGTSAYLLLS